LPVGARRLEFSVGDTWSGIDAVRLRKLYQHVRRPPAAQREHFSSSGLGLTICRKLVRAMGSELQIETRPQWGTRFYFEVDAPVGSAAA